MRNIILMGCCLFLFATQSCINKAKNYNKETNVDQDALGFIDSALEGGNTEVGISKIAAARSTNPRIIGFAKMMVTDHTQAGAELNKVRAKEMVDKPDSISVDHKKKIDSIAALSGSQFDKAYMDMMVADHEKTVAMFNSTVNVRAGAVQAFAKKTLPTLQMHLDSAKAIDSSLH